MENRASLDEEYLIGSDAIISQTDKEGVITYVNKAFCETSGYQVDDLVGNSHTLLRHPEMPSTIFTKMWETISGGQAWNGLIKNRRADGKFYWVETEILPIKDDDENVTGYIAVRKEASRKDINETQETYKKMLETQE